MAVQIAIFAAAPTGKYPYRYNKVKLSPDFQISAEFLEAPVKCRETPPDKRSVKSVATVVQQTAWLYTRGDASVHMSLDDQVSPPVLVIRGPGVAVATYDFPDLVELRAFAQAQEKRLQDEGFHLAASAERRAGRERRQTPRLGVIDRRQQEQ